MFSDRIHNIEGSDNMYQAGLVLEGGGMKGVYTAGVQVQTPPAAQMPPYKNPSRCPGFLFGQKDHVC